MKQRKPRVMRHTAFTPQNVRKQPNFYFFEMIYLEMLVVRMKRIADSIIKDIEELKSEGKI